MTDEATTEPDPADELLASYRFPDPLRRRTSGVVLLLTAIGLAVGGAVRDDGLWVGAIVVGVLAVWFLGSAWPLRVNQEQALSEGMRAVEFPVGHASAAVTFHGIRSRPRWLVVLYEAGEPPEARALVTVDAVDGNQPDPVYTEKL